MTLLDTGPLVALLDRSDAQHEWSTGRMREVSRPLMVCEAVTSEACFLLADLPQARQQLRLWMQSEFISHVPLSTALVGRAMLLMERYANVPMSFDDACIVALAERAPQAKIFTIDRDFLIYRRMDNQPLTLLAPFAS
jgi:predicted nucleic acid-binding protein